MTKDFHTNKSSPFSRKGQIKASDRDSFLEQLQLKALNSADIKDDPNKKLKVEFFKTKPKSLNHASAGKHKSDSFAHAVVCSNANQQTIKNTKMPFRIEH